MSQNPPADKKVPHVRRPPNAFFVFRNELNAKIKLEEEAEEKRNQQPRRARPGRRLQNDLSKDAGVLWNSLHPEAQQVYYEKARSLKKRHSEEHPGYVYKPRRRSKSEKSLRGVTQPVRKHTLTPGSGMGREIIVENPVPATTSTANYVKVGGYSGQHDLYNTQIPSHDHHTPFAGAPSPHDHNFLSQSSGCRASDPLDALKAPPSREEIPTMCPHELSPGALATSGIEEDFERLRIDEHVNANQSEAPCTSSFFICLPLKPLTSRYVLSARSPALPNPG